MIGFQFETPNQSVFAELSAQNWKIRENDHQPVQEIESAIEVADIFGNLLVMHRNGPHRFVLFLEGTIFVSGQSENNNWPITSLDLLTGHVIERYDWTFKQVWAVCKIAIAGDDHPDCEALYRIVRPLFIDWPNECCPIP